MQYHIQTIVHQLFRKNSLGDVTVQELQQFVDTYPFSAVGRFLFAKKLKDTDAQNQTDESAMASMYFNDPLWLQWLLQGHEDSLENSLQSELHTRESIVASDALATDYVHQPVHIPDPPAPAGEAESPEISQPGEQEENKEQPAAMPEAGTDAPEITAEQPVVTAEEKPETPNSSPDPAPPEEKPAPVKEQDKEPEVKEPEPAAEEKTAPATGDTVSEEKKETEKEEHGTSFSKPAAGSADDDKPVVTFEPYHTIDYFASQGIRLRQEDLKNDKLGRQLKSFTDWLRSMKRITPEDDHGAIEEVVAHSIQRFAESSVEAKEILTETMAEVWAKQGNAGKAIAIYEKLSLLNPAKSTYFASKIAALKGN